MQTQGQCHEVKLFLSVHVPQSLGSYARLYDTKMGAFLLGHAAKSSKTLTHSHSVAGGLDCYFLFFLCINLTDNI